MNKQIQKYCYLGGTEKYKESYVLMAWCDDAPFDMKENLVYSLFDIGQKYEGCDKKLTVDYVVKKLMQYIIEKNEHGRFYITLCFNDILDTFEFCFYYAEYFDSQMDARDFYLNVNKSKDKFILNNILGLVYTGNMLFVVDKQSYLNVFKDNDFSYMLSYNYFNLVSGKDNYYTQITYEKIEDYWFIQAGTFNFLLSREEEAEPFTTYNLVGVSCKKANKLEIVNWLKDDIISKIPNSDVCFESDIEAVEMANASKSTTEIIDEFEKMYHKDIFQRVETDRYVAEFSIEKFLAFKVISKANQKIVCLAYYS